MNIKQLLLSNIPNLKPHHWHKAQTYLEVLDLLELGFTYNANSHKTILRISPEKYRNNYYFLSSRPLLHETHPPLSISIDDSGKLEATTKNDNHNFTMLALLHLLISPDTLEDNGDEHLLSLNQALRHRFHLAQDELPQIESIYMNHKYYKVFTKSSFKNKSPLANKKYEVFDGKIFPNASGIRWPENSSLCLKELSLILTTTMSNTFVCLSNGMALSLENFLHHPYSWIFNDFSETIVQTASQPIAAYETFEWPLDHYHYNYRSAHKPDFFIQFFKNIKNRFEHIPIYLGPFTNEDDIRIKDSVPVDNLLVLPRDILSIQKMSTHSFEIPPGDIVLEVNRKGQRPSYDFSTDSFLYKSDSQQLYLKNSDDTRTALRRSLAEVCKLKTLKDSQKQLKTSKKYVHLSDYPNPDTVQKVVQIFCPEFSIKELENKENVKAHLSFNLSSQDNQVADVYIKWPAGQTGTFHYLTHVSYDLQLILRGFEAGIAGALNSESKYLAKRDFYKRPNELKLYKHQGLFLMMVAEACHLVQKNETMKRSKQLKILDQKIAQFCYTLLTKENPPEKYALSDLSDSFVTRTFKTNINRVFKKIFATMDASLVYLHNDCAIDVDLNDIIKNLLLWIVGCKLKTTSPSKRFIKSRYEDLYFNTNASLDTAKINALHLEESHSLLPQSCSLFKLSTQKTPLPVQEALPYGQVTVDDTPIEQLKKEDIKTQIDIRSGHKDKNIDWFELHPKYFFKGVEISPHLVSDFLSGKVIEYEGRFYQIGSTAVPSLKWLNHFWQRISQVGSKATVDALRRDNLEINLKRHHILELLALKRSGTVINGDEAWVEISRNFDQLDNFQELNKKAIDNSLKKFQGKLKNFQYEGLNWFSRLHSLGLGGLLSDDMGLGKTVQTIAFLNYLNEQKKLGPSLIVAPTSLMYNWEQELERFCPHLSVTLFDPRYFDKAEKKLEKNEVIICTYGLLLEHKEYFLNYQWDLCIFDEIQNLKNIRAKRSTVARDLNCRFKYGLSGTPMENHFGELYSVIDLTVPGALGPYDQFIKDYKVTTTVDDQLYRNKIDFLKKTIKPLVLRRTKEAVLTDLPDKEETVISIPFDSKQEKIYKSVALSWNNQVQDIVSRQGESQAQLQMLTALLRLRQVCSCPQSVPNVSYKNMPPKIEFIVEKLIDLIDKNQSVVVFTNFVYTLDYLNDVLKKNNITTLTLSGRDSMALRKKTLLKFNQDDKACVLLMTLKTGGVGLNLTKANYVFHLEPWWNPAAENQGTDRVHRIGQRQSVNVYRYIMRNSIEEKIQKLKTKKTKAFNSIFSESDPDSGDLSQVQLSSSQLSQEDFQWLLS